MRSKSEVFQNRAKFRTFFALQNFRGATPESSHACLAARNVDQFHEVIPLGPKLIASNMLNLKPIFVFSLLEIVGGPVSPVRCGLASLCTCKNLREQHPLRGRFGLL